MGLNQRCGQTLEHETELERSNHGMINSGFVCTNPKDEAEIKKRIESVILSPRWNWAWTCEEEDYRLVASFPDEAYKRHQS